MKKIYLFTLVLLVACTAVPPAPTLVPTAVLPSATPSLTPPPFPSATLPATWTPAPQPSPQATQTRLPSPTAAPTVSSEADGWPVDEIPAGTLTPTPANMVPAEAQRAFAAATRAWERGDMEQALIQLDQALLLAPEHSGFLSLRGQVHVALLHPLQGESDLRTALSLDPFSALARRTLAELFASYGRWREAAAEYERYLALAPADSDTWFALGQIYELRNQPLAAIDAYSMTLSLDPAHVEGLGRRAEMYYLAGNLEAAWPDYTTLIEITPTVDLYELRAEISLDLDAPLLAAADFQQAISLTLLSEAPTYTLMIRMGEAYLAAGAPIRAADTFSEAIRLTDSVEPRLLLGESYLLGQDYPAALEVYSSTLALGSALESQPVLLGRGRALLGLGEYQAAMVDFDRAISLAATAVEQAIALAGRSELYVALEQIPKAVADLTTAYETSGDLVYLYRRGVVYQTAGDTEAAVTDLTAFLEDADPEEIDPALVSDAQARLESLTP